MAKEHGIEIEFRAPYIQEGGRDTEGGLKVVKRLLRKCKGQQLGKHYYGILDFVHTRLQE